MPEPSRKKIHITLPDALHRKLRVQCALEGTTIQEFVEKLVAEAVSDVHLPRRK